MSDPTTSELDPDEILVAEFNYIAQSAFQANEDRARVSNYYIVAVFATIGAILSANVFASGTGGLSPTIISLALGGMFFVLTAIGYYTVLQLARLRAAWEDSAQAMNKIKNYYRRKYTHIAPAFLWTNKTLPKADRPDSVARLLVLSVSSVIVGTVIAVTVCAGLAIEPLIPLHLQPPEFQNWKLYAFGGIGIVLGFIFRQMTLRKYNLILQQSMDNLQQRLDAHKTMFPEFTAFESQNPGS
jgi:uncharacterized membrane-anchored protein YhcB (DUF1043 family)